MSDITQILRQIEHADLSSSDKLLPLVYEELRKLAGARLAQENPGQTLQATALVHDAYLRLVDVPKAQEWQSRGHFFSAAAEAMRRILVERARRRGRLRHGGQHQRVDLDDGLLAANQIHEDLLELDAALTEYAEIEPEKAELVKFRYFAGMTIDEAADALGISRSTAKRHWTLARAWLLAKLSDSKKT